jgi:two-component system, cell cycle sensor histidine kinase and response regulator CckA
MDTNPNAPDKVPRLRRVAEAIAAHDGKRAEVALSPEAMRDALHELHVHQIELEMQNEELRRAHGELETSRAKYFDLYDLAPVGYVTLNSIGLLLQANLTAATLLGVDRSALLKRPLTRFILPEDQDVFYLHRKRLFETGTRQACEFRMLREGSFPWWASAEMTLSTTADTANACRLVLIDISERKRAEEEKHRLETLLRQQQRLQSVGTLASGVAHEINNPLTGLLNYAQLLYEEVEKGSQPMRYVEEILEAGQRVAAIVRHLTSLGRADADGSKPVRMHDIVERTLSLLRVTLQLDKITLTREIPLDLPFIECNAPQIQQVLMNVLINAHESLNEKYPGGHPSKTIAIHAKMLEGKSNATLPTPHSPQSTPHSPLPTVHSPQSTPHSPLPTSLVRLTVEDRGLGIPADVQSRVFDPFFTTKGQATFSGLGLAIAHSIVRTHGGEMSLESKEGQFTRIHIDLPTT